MADKKRGINRRNFVGGAVVGAAVTSFPLPHIAGAQAKVIKVGMPTILSGRVAILGTSSRPGAQVAFNAINEAGGINGRKLELVDRDSKGRPDEAAKVTRDLINNDGCEIIIDAEASSGSFAVHEVIRDLGALCLHSCSESSTLTAEPKQKVKTAFRCARQGIHDAVAGGSYAARIAKDKGLKKWMTISPDYAYGRDNTGEFIQYAKQFEPSIEVVDQLWPKLFAPDYTESITKALQVKPQAVYSALWGGDLVAFIEQSNLYRLFQNITYFSGGLGDPPILTAIKNLPPGLNTVYRYNKKYPDHPDNEKFNDDYVKLAGHEPTNWGWQNFVAANFIIEALKRTGGKTDGAALASEVAGMKLKTPMGVDGTITMRDTDHTIINYPVAWGKTIAKAPWVIDYVDTEWSKILEIEQQWKKEKGYT